MMMLVVEASTVGNACCSEDLLYEISPLYSTRRSFRPGPDQEFLGCLQVSPQAILSWPLLPISDVILSWASTVRNAHHAAPKSRTQHCYVQE